MGVGHGPPQSGGIVFGHDGVNEPTISAALRINPMRDAIIITATGPSHRARGQWVF